MKGMGLMRKIIVTEEKGVRATGKIFGGEVDNGESH